MKVGIQRSWMDTWKLRAKRSSALREGRGEKEKGKAAMTCRIAEFL